MIGIIEATKARARIYSLLSRVFADHLDATQGHPSEFATHLMDPSLAEVLGAEQGSEAVSEAWNRLADATRGLASDHEVSAAAQREYVSLFLLPTGVQPYESVYRDPERLLMGKPWTEVRAFYRECGVSIAEAEQHPEDHIAAELAFMSAVISGEITGESAPVTVQHTFLRRHLLSWVPELTERIGAHASALYYLCAADLLLQWLLFEDQWLGQVAAAEA